MKVYIGTFGCRANHYDSEAARAMLEASGARIVATPDEADAAIFNSCAVTVRAEADLRAGIRRAARANPRLRTVVMGCAAALDEQRDAGSSLRVLPTVESVIGGADLEGVAHALDLDPSLSAARAARQTGARALLRIQDGCDEHCTFCTTTLARGSNRSRPVDELVVEAERLADSHAEIVLTGVHIGTYGGDTGTSLSALVERLVRAVPRARFRLSSVEATEVDDRLRELLTARDSGLVPYLHAPLQSGSETVLRRMGRHWYTATSYAAAVERIVGEASVFGLGADIIAGFPGETEDDHRSTVALVESLPFTGLHVFPYSLRPGTAAERLGGRVGTGDVSRRAAELRGIGALKALEYERSRIGGSADVVVVGGASGSGARKGISEDYLTVTVAECDAPRGSRIATLLESRDGALFARPVEL
ncbi:MAG TPA: MiaB/RimO family radical SAM methylthiotransferase [Gemmatimonadaceae bacterium]|nr:MiaB/RimO family radical SAM methylthiotransferase [Gemmatimonadaceae bacterium]